MPIVKLKTGIPNVRFVGFQRDISSVYCAADVFVFPSLEEGGPQVAYEAAAHGLPLVATRMGGGWIARHRHNALIVTPSDADALAQALTEISEDAALRRDLAAHAVEDVAQFEWTAVADRRRQALLALAG